MAEIDSNLNRSSFVMENLGIDPSNLTTQDTNVQKDKGTLDTTERSDFNISQNLRTTGDPSVPVLTMTFNTSVDGNLKSNPFFNPSFLANFQSIMDELLNLQRNTHYLEAQVELKQRALIITISTTQSELTKALYDSRAEEKMIEAITSFVQAGIAGLSLAQTWANTGIARGNAQKTVDNNISHERSLMRSAEDKKAALATEKAGIENRPLVGTDPNNMTPRPYTNAEKTRLKEIEKENTALDKKIAKHQENIQEFEKPGYFRQVLESERQILNTQTQFKNEILKNIVNGISQSLQAGLISEQGAIDSLKTMNDGYLDVLRKYADSTAKSRDEAKADFDKTLDFVNKIVDSVFKAHSLGPA
ncbi:hypothetical protein [Candidatus Protochlamydia sp. R18]|uniref:hypothetical protein n=1 Tax=Candidatus Protochlamydia sp. R18 TaxID=1353977 RepID=UPI0005A63396|nr:hypothetical protein [Candidatus Protochlamydia sp. R18]